MTRYLHILNDLFLFMFSGSCIPWVQRTATRKLLLGAEPAGFLIQDIFCWRSQLFPLLGGQVTLTVLDDIVEFSGRR